MPDPDFVVRFSLLPISVEVAAPADWSLRRLWWNVVLWVLRNAAALILAFFPWGVTLAVAGLWLLDPSSEVLSGAVYAGLGLALAGCSMLLFTCCVFLIPLAVKTFRDHRKENRL